MVDIGQAIWFLDTEGRPLDAAWAHLLVDDGDKDTVVAALASYQNSDGGFGKALEPDIAASVSQPFAARMAMQILSSLGEGSGGAMTDGLTEWLVRNQDEDGCWRLPPEVHDHALAPWFAGWTFPSLNPALCLSGWATRLGIGPSPMHERVRDLFDRTASLEEVAKGGFYELLPYVEYVPWVAHPRRDEYLEALAGRITEIATAGGYDDAGHFFAHLGPAGGPIAVMVSVDLVSDWLDRLGTEQEEDGGWPSPYAVHWRSWATATAVEVLRDYGRT